MNRERAKELLPVIKAFSEGKTIQYQQVGMIAWLDINPGEEECFTDKGKYRIKPEPREFWIHEGSMHAYCVANLDPTIKMIHVREVLE